MRFVPPVSALADHQVFRLLTMRALQEDQIYIDEHAVSDQTEYDKCPSNKCWLHRDRRQRHQAFIRRIAPLPRSSTLIMRAYPSRDIVVWTCPPLQSAKATIGNAAMLANSTSGSKKPKAA